MLQPPAPQRIAAYRRVPMATKSLENSIIELADREAIRELPQRYCDCVWRGDVAGIINLYAENGTFAVKGAGRDRAVTGRADLTKAYEHDLTSIKPRPYIHNHVIELKGNGRASGRCYVEVRDASKNWEMLGTGYYNDEYVKVGDEWKFQSRSANLV
jgi:SnoaL-like domain